MRSTIVGISFLSIFFLSCRSNDGQDHVSDMKLIPGGRFQMGSEGTYSSEDEKPMHEVIVSSFWMDESEVTNKQFLQFVESTGYITVAERVPDWNEIKKYCEPEDTLVKPNLFAGALIFQYPQVESLQNELLQRWKFQEGACWKFPLGPGSSIDSMLDYPVVHITWEDANAYAGWAGKRLPTEAEWEWAARGGLKHPMYPWGNEPPEEGKSKANFFQGNFPFLNTGVDGFEFSAPVKSFSPNGYGLYDMAGNVWEICSDWYHHDYYKDCKRKGVSINPKGPEGSLDPEEPGMPKHVTRGGSFLCNEGYCTGYRVSRRMKVAYDTGLIHTGFRCVKDVMKSIP